MYRSHPATQPTLTSSIFVTHLQKMWGIIGIAQVFYCLSCESGQKMAWIGPGGPCLGGSVLKRQELSLWLICCDWGSKMTGKMAMSPFIITFLISYHPDGLPEDPETDLKEESGHMLQGCQALANVREDSVSGLGCSSGTEQLWGAQAIWAMGPEIYGPLGSWMTTSPSRVPHFAFCS